MGGSGTVPQCRVAIAHTGGPNGPSASELRAVAAVRLAQAKASVAPSRVLPAIAVAAALAAQPTANLQRSVELLLRGDLESAEAAAALALEDPATKPVAQAMIGSIRLRQERYREGVDLLESAVEANPRLLGARLNLAHAYALAGEPARSEATYRRVIELAPDNAAARLALARVESARGNYRAALAVVGPVEDKLRESPDGLLVLAEAHAAAGNRGAVLQLADAWKRQRGVPREPSMRFALSISKTGLNQEAIAILENLKREGLGSYEVAFNLGGLYLLEDNLAKAAENYELAVGLDDQSVPALRQVALIAERRGELEKALSYLIRAKLESPDDAGIQFSFGTVALRLELAEDAKQALSRALELQPGHRAARYWLATAHGAAGEYDSALALYKGLLSEEPDEAQLHYAVGTVHYLRSEFAAAARHLSESRRLKPDQLLSPYYLAMIDQKEGRFPESIRAFDAILERHPEHAPSYEGLAVSLVKERRFEEARQNFETALRLNPNSVRASYQYGQLLVRMGRRSEAQRYLAIAEELRQKDEEAQLVRTLLNPH